MNIPNPGQTPENPEEFLRLAAEAKLSTTATPLHALAAASHELFTAYQEAGFTDDQALRLTSDFMTKVGRTDLGG